MFMSLDVAVDICLLQRGVPAHVRWGNDLKDATGAYLPHILRDSIDQTLHWCGSRKRETVLHCLGTVAINKADVKAATRLFADFATCKRVQQLFVT